LSNLKKHLSFFLLLAGILAAFGSCASKSAVRENRMSAWLTDKSKFNILSPEFMENSMDNQQFISASYGNMNFQAIAWVKADKNGIEMILMNELGNGLGELSYRDGAILFSSPVFPQSVGGEYIVADFQLCFYNAHILRKALEDCGLSFEENDKGRRIYSGETLIIDIEKSGNAVRFVNHLREYSYTIESEF